jgi:hypothetical protein
MTDRITREAGRFALVDGIPFQLPVAGHYSPALMAAYAVDAAKAQALLPGDEIHALRVWRDKALLLITVIDYRQTNIGKYIEFSVAIACTHGARPAPMLLPGVLQGRYGTGQYVYDLPVSTEISVKGGKGIWGMPKHQANLNYTIGERRVSSQYDLDGQLAIYIEIARPRFPWIPLRTSGVNYCAFRGMLMKSVVNFHGRLGFTLFKHGSARLVIGDHPRVRPLKDLGIGDDPIFTAFFPGVDGVLDDHVESWFLSETQPPTQAPEGLSSVVDLGLSQEWLPPPDAPVPDVTDTRAWVEADGHKAAFAYGK